MSKKLAASPDLTATAGRRCSHRVDSGTPLRIHNVTSAGRMPTKNTIRQLEKCSTTPATRAASAYPMAHELCTMARARARSSVGQVSATRAAPVFHSPHAQAQDEAEDGQHQD